MYRDGELVCESVGLNALAQSHGTPAYVYSKQAILDRFHTYEDGLAGVPHRICYAVKANSNLAVLATLAAAGAGFDIVSGGELYRVLAAGGKASSSCLLRRRQNSTRDRIRARPKGFTASTANPPPNWN